LLLYLMQGLRLPGGFQLPGLSRRNPNPEPNPQNPNSTSQHPKRKPRDDADKAGDAAVLAAKAGDLELRGVSFSYPLRADMPGGRPSNSARRQIGSR
jgi:hypothetical protein